MKLVDLTTKALVQELAGDSATPGGGSMAAYAGALSAGLCAMVGRLTVGKTKYHDAWEAMQAVIHTADELAQRFLVLMDEDARAYSAVTAAFKLPQKSAGQQTQRQSAIEKAMRQAAQVPLETLREASKLLKLAQTTVAHGNPNCITDTGVAIQMLQTAALGAAYNVRINISSLKDTVFASQCNLEVDQRLTKIKAVTAELANKVDLNLRKTS